jgi:hypothetical protein
LFDCETSPSLPGLSMRTGVLLLLAPFCFDVAFASDHWPVIAFCPTAWT